MVFRLLTSLFVLVLPMMSYAAERTGTASYRERIALPPTYQGVISGDGEQQTWQLALAADQTFQLVQQFDDGTQHARLGRWQAAPGNDQLVLRDGADMPLVIAANGQAGFNVVDAGTGTAFEGSLSRLEKAPQMALRDMTLGGMMTYMADAGLFEECASGLRFPGFLFIFTP